MQDARPSVTAMVTGYVRAYHALDPARRGLFNDTVAPALFTPGELAGIGRNLAEALPAEASDGQDGDARLAIAMSLPWRSITLARSRFAEDRLLAAIERGVSQCVQVGAGLDTFALRHPELADRLQVIELDHPATQHDKCSRLERAGISVPANLHLAPVDLAVTPLEQALAATPFDAARPCFFMWLGVTYYLVRPAVMATLQAISQRSAPGSELAFDYINESVLVAGTSPDFDRLQAILHHIGEPMLTGFAPARLGTELKSAGLTLVEDLDADAIDQRYFEPHLPGYHASRHLHFARATVG